MKIARITGLCLIFNLLPILHGINNTNGQRELFGSYNKPPACDHFQAILNSTQGVIYTVQSSSEHCTCDKGSFWNEQILNLKS